MLKQDDVRFAVIADAHFHDVRADFGFAGFPVGDEHLVLRPLEDVARSPRLYNEAGQALRHVLERLAEVGITRVVLLGDYLDDGQRETLRCLQRLLDHFRQHHGMCFYALPGNHDIYGDRGRHRRKRYLGEAGERVLVASDPRLVAASTGPAVLSDAMYCGGYPDNLPDHCGFFGAPDALHFETPFGPSPLPEHRMFDIAPADDTGRRRLMDGSYLVEPVEGLWLAMIDANVFVPDPDGEDGLADSTSAGWNAVLARKPFLLDWLKDVADRARMLGKRLIALSHYPALDPLGGVVAEEIAMMGRNSLHDRVPWPEVGEALAKAGICLHFSGHVHVNTTAHYRSEGGAHLTNIAVPALVAFPVAAKIVTVSGAMVRIDTLSLDDMPLDPLLIAAYEMEFRLNRSPTGAMRACRTYGALASAHLAHVTGRRFLKREWPAALADLFRRLSLAELVRQTYAADASALFDVAEPLTALDFLADWYRLRAGGRLAVAAISPDRLALYRALAALEPAGLRQNDNADKLALLFATLVKRLDGLPSDALTVNLETGEILAVR
nr:metallophosphoesterase [uncultured Gellertiella sp.]